MIKVTEMHLTLSAVDEGCRSGKISSARRDRVDMAALVVNQMMDWIDTHLAEPINVESVARTSGYSRYHLMRMFKKHTGTSLALYIKQRRIDAALQLLTNSNERIMMISYQVGIDSPQSFSRMIKEKFNMSPSELRRSSRKSYCHNLIPSSCQA